MKHSLLILLIFIFFDARANVSDTIHVSHYNLSLDTIDFIGHSIKGEAELTVHAKMNGVNNISLGLYLLTIDSITSAGLQLTYVYDDTTIHITPPSVLNINDSVVLQ